MSGLIDSTRYILKNEQNQKEATIITTQSNLPFNLSDVTEELLYKKTGSTKSKVTSPSNRSSDLIEWTALNSNDLSLQRSDSPIPEDDFNGKTDRSLRNLGRPGFNRGICPKTNNNLDLNSLALELNNIRHENGSFPNYFSISELQSDKLIRRGSFSRQTMKSKNLYFNLNLKNLKLFFSLSLSLSISISFRLHRS